ncbi:energy transducer TonB [Vicingaceae bacterium]|nr:energy transducer TonB [Vicingaceae bacterium]
MEIKKSASKNLERKRGMFFQIGLVTSLSFALVAFQYTSPKLTPKVKDQKVYTIDEDIIPITIMKSAKPLPKPKPPKPLTNQFKVVKTIDVISPVAPVPKTVELPPNIIIATNPPEIIDENEIFVNVELMPGLGECSLLDKTSRALCTEQAIQAFIIDNINIPPSVKDRGEGGKVFVSFVVNKKGNVEDVNILRGLAGAKAMDKEVTRVINLLPQFSPGEQTGRKANVRYIIPINIQIG